MIHPLGGDTPRHPLEAGIVGLSSSELAFFSTQKHSAERSLKKRYFKTMNRKQFGL